jgi:TP901 family phage tail tape measure protein
MVWLNKLVKGAAAIGVIVTAFRTINRAVSSVVSTFTEFEFVMAKVNAISGATEKEFAALTATAEELGRTTFFTAEQVGQLQLNFSKLGFSAQEIMNAQKATLDLATATGSDLARSATVAASTIRGFGLDASETQRVVDVMAVSFSTSALDIEKFQTSMTKVAPIAKAAGFSLEDTTTIMAKLSDAGIEASIAGTSLRNILLKMQDPSSDLSKSFGTTIHSLDELIPAMRNFSAEGGDMAAVMEVVDLRQAAAFELMLANVDILKSYRDSLKDSGGEASRMAGIVGDTLQGAFLKLKSATEGLAISIMKDFNEGLQSTTETLAKWGNFLSENSKVISGLIKFVMRLTQVVVAGYVAQKVATAAVFAYNTALYAYTLATKGATAATALFTKGVTRMKAALVTSGIGAAVVGLGYLIEKFLLTADATDKVTKSTEKLVEERKTINELLDREIAATKLVSDQNIKDYEAELQRSKLRRKLAEDELKRSNANFYANQNTINQEKTLQKNLEDRIKLEKKYQKSRQQAEDKEKALKTDLLYIAQEELKLIKETPAATEEEVAARNKNIEALEKEIKRLNELGIAKKADIVSMDIVDPYTSSAEDLEKLKAQDEEFFKQQEEKGKQRLQMFQSFSDSIFTIIGNNAQRRAERDAKILEERKEAGLITEEQYEAQLEQVQRKAFERKKRLDITEAIINGALAMTKVTAQTGVLAFAFSPFIAAMTAAQIAVIASQKFANGGMIEEFANGGMVQGKSHAQGGEKFAVGGRVVELEGGEAVINKRSTAMFKGQLSAMNAAGGGVKFADGGLMNMPSFASSQFDATNQQNMMGAMNQSNRVIVVEADITESQNTVGIIEAEATF